MDIPESIRSTEHLEELLSEPSERVVEALRQLDGDILILGAGGKIGPSLARMARRASDAAGVKRRVIAVSLVWTQDSERELNAQGIETIRCDLLDHARLADVPEAKNIVFMAGMKFGSTGQEALTWAMNAYLPGMVCERFPDSRIVAFSTGNIYGLTPVTSGGSVETDALGPVGDYAQSCVGRERMLEHFSRTLGTQVAIMRLNYAVEMRYGVIADIAWRIHDGKPIDLTMGNVNVIWQGDANAAALCALQLAASPPFVLNVSGPEILSVRRLAEDLAGLMGREATFEGEESSLALLSNSRLCHSLFGYPRVTAQTALGWIAQWVTSGGESLNRPTHFETRDGKF
jgi:nucleoside-diphosphate-sugar epimerase